MSDIANVPTNVPAELSAEELEIFLAQNDGDKLVLIFAAVRRVENRLANMEQQAKDMMSPDKLMEVAGAFLGGDGGGLGGLFGGKF